MALTDRELLKTAQAGMIGSANTAADPMVTVKAAHTRTYTLACQDAATAGTAITETVIARMPVAGRITACYCVAPIAVANDASNIVTFAVNRQRAAVSVAAAAADTTTTTGIAFAAGLAAFVPKAMTLSATSANLDVAAGDVITFSAAKGASGKALVAATSYFLINVTVEENGV